MYAVWSHLCGSSALTNSLPHDWIIECSSLALINPFDPKEINYSRLTISHKSRAAPSERDLHLHFTLQETQLKDYITSLLSKMSL